MVKYVDNNPISSQQVDEVKKIRRSFAFVGDTLYIQQNGDYRPMRQALVESTPTSQHMADTALRGFFDGNSIVFYKGDHVPVAYQEVTEKKILEVAVQNSNFGNIEIIVWKDLLVGKPGELWPAVEALACVGKNGEIWWIED